MKNVSKRDLVAPKGMLYEQNQISTYFDSFTYAEMEDRIQTFKSQEEELKKSNDMTLYNEALKRTLDVETVDGTLRCPFGNRMEYSAGAQFVRAYRLNPDDCDFESFEFMTLPTSYNLWEAKTHQVDIGRYNEKGVPLLYTCFHHDRGDDSVRGVQTEIQLKHNEVYVLIFYTAFKPFSVVDVCSVSYLPKDKQKKDLIIDFMAECLFTSDRSDFEHIYNKSLAMLNFIYEMRADDFIGWGMPSVQVAGVNNICFPPELAREHLAVEKAYICQFRGSDSVAVLATTTPDDDGNLDFAKANKV